jgi:hypothetical protein
MLAPKADIRARSANAEAGISLIAGVTQRATSRSDCGQRLFLMVASVNAAEMMFVNSEFKFEN